MQLCNIHRTSKINNLKILLHAAHRAPNLTCVIQQQGPILPYSRILKKPNYLDDALHCIPAGVPSGAVSNCLIRIMILTQLGNPFA